jgi:hypothetical protein
MFIGTRLIMIFSSDREYEKWKNILVGQPERSNCFGYVEVKNFRGFRGCGVDSAGSGCGGKFFWTQ